MNRKKMYSICAILLMLSIISCSSSDSMDNNDSMAMPNPTATSMPEPTATSMPEPTATSMPTDNKTMSPKSKEISEVNITMSEWDVNVASENSLKEGSIKLTLTNSGNLEHNMVLINDENYENLELTEDASMADETKLDILGKISSLQPGESGELIIEDIKPGTYAFICNTPGHYQLGMVNKIIVE